MKMKILFTVAITLCLCVNAHAAITLTETKLGPNKYVQQATVFNAFNIAGAYGTTTGYVYEAPNLNGANDGWVLVNKATRVSVQIGIDTLASGTRTCRIEGRTLTNGRACAIYARSYNTATTIDEIIPVGEAIVAIRTGWNTTAVAGASDSVHTYVLIEVEE